MITCKLTENQVAIINASLYHRVEYFKDLLENYEGFGVGIKELYESELKWAEETLKFFQEL